jgi:hypothetical protein
VKVMAKDLIRTRHQITKFYGLKSQLQGISLRIQVGDGAGIEILFQQKGGCLIGVCSFKCR